MSKSVIPHQKSSICTALQTQEEAKAILPS